MGMDICSKVLIALLVMASPVSFMSFINFWEGSTVDAIASSYSSLVLLNKGHSLSLNQTKFNSHFKINKKNSILLTSIHMPPFMTFDATDISDSYSKRLISNVFIVSAIIFSGSIVFPLPFKLELRLSIFLFSFFFHTWWWFIQEVDAQLFFAFFTDHRP